MNWLQTAEMLENLQALQDFDEFTINHYGKLLLRKDLVIGKIELTLTYMPQEMSFGLAVAGSAEMIDVFYLYDDDGEAYYPEMGHLIGLCREKLAESLS